ncbi:MAG: hypothetical protein JSS61_02785 [Verrucomicrobia bacterium]|nr:hypothetical protein [Verrucomicrobiota bacterium]
MRKIAYRPYLFLGLAFLCLFSIPQSSTERMRGFFVCSFAPVWRGIHLLGERSLFLKELPIAKAKEESDLLAQENQLLRSQIDNVREWLLSEDRIQSQAQLLAAGIDQPLLQRRNEALSRRIALQIQSIPATVVFREPASWSSILWINVGEKENRQLGKRVIAKNSPVLSGTSIVGIVEYVGEATSRVRLITDRRLVPSVRALRGGEQNRHLVDQVDAVLFALERRSELFQSAEEEALCLQLLARLKTQIQRIEGESYLAKGELHGGSCPLWRARGQKLKGVGFNYDFADEEGPARDLRTGMPYDASRKKQDPIPLLRPGDLLITTGLDGIFPAGFPVALISKIDTLKEGASSYEIDAVPTAGNLDTLSHLTVLAPLS